MVDGYSCCVLRTGEKLKQEVLKTEKSEKDVVKEFRIRILFLDTEMKHYTENEKGEVMF